MKFITCRHGRRTTWGAVTQDGEGVVDALRGACHTAANGHVKGYAAKALERIATPESLYGSPQAASAVSVAATA